MPFALKCSGRILTYYTSEEAVFHCLSEDNSGHFALSIPYIRHILCALMRKAVPSGTHVFISRVRLSGRRTLIPPHISPCWHILMRGKRVLHVFRLRLRAGCEESDYSITPEYLVRRREMLRRGFPPRMTVVRPRLLCRLTGDKSYVLSVYIFRHATSGAMRPPPTLKRYRWIILIISQNGEYGK